MSSSKPTPTRHQQEVNAAMEKIKEFNRKIYKGWRLKIPVWKLAVEGACVFMLAFLIGLGFAVLFEVIRR